VLSPDGVLVYFTLQTVAWEGLPCCGGDLLSGPTSFEQEMKWARQGVASDGKILIPGKTTWLVPEKYSRPDSSDLSAEASPATTRSTSTCKVSSR
jgi:hypothetical protein